MLLKNTTLLISGSARGIGKATASMAASQGAKGICLTDIDKEALRTTTHELKLQFPNVQFISIAGDLTDPTFSTHLVSTTISQFNQLNHVVNNAGILRDALIPKMSISDWEEIMSIHLTAPFHLIKALSPHFTTTPHPKTITNISSVSAYGNVGQLNYSTAKSGLIGFTKTIAQEWARYHVRSNAVAFGFMDTRMTDGIPEKVKSKLLERVPMKRVGSMEEAAGSIVFLMSPLSGYITGQVLNVNGGIR